MYLAASTRMIRYSFGHLISELRLLSQAPSCSIHHQSCAMNVDALSNELPTLGITRSCLQFEPSAELVLLRERFQQYSAIRDYSNDQELLSIVQRLAHSASHFLLCCTTFGPPIFKSLLTYLTISS